MTVFRLGAIAAFGAAGTYLVGFGLLVGLLLPAGYGFDPTSASEAVSFLARNAGMMVAWNSVIYILNAVCVAVLVVALHAALSPRGTRLMQVASLFGLVWVGLLLAAGMLANSAVATVAALAGNDPDQAATIWQVLRAVENGLGGGNEIAGALWILTSMAPRRPWAPIPITVRAIGCIAGCAGLLTLLPTLSEPMGAVFGLATLVWFLGIGATLLRHDRNGGAPSFASQTAETEVP